MLSFCFFYFGNQFEIKLFKNISFAAENHKRINILEEYILLRYTSVPREVARMIATHTHNICKKYDVSFKLVVGVMEIESNFNPYAKSSSGAKGLMQVMPSIWAETLNIDNPQDLHSIEKGIDAGVQILKHYLEKNRGNIPRALKNYNGTTKDTYHLSVFSNIGRFTLFKEQRM